jgi:predicted nucleic acid-binding protein
VALGQARRYARSAVLSYLTALHANADIQVIWVDEALHLDGLALLAARSDKTYSLCDAVSFLLMRRLRITDALTTDRHFQQEGFRQLLQ